MPAVGAAGRLDLYAYPGIALPVSLVWLPDGVTPVDLTGWSARAQIRPDRDSADVLFEWVAGDFTLGGDAGTIEFSADGAETAPWAAWAKKLNAWDLVMTDPAGVVQDPLIEGAVLVRRPVTR